MVDIGTRVEPFVDTWLLEQRTGVELRVHPPERREVVLTTDRPWEGPDSAYYSVFRDGDRVRLYYRGYCPADLSDMQVTCYAESRDGVRFARPNLGQFEFGGSTANNIVFRGRASHNLAPFRDSNPAAAPDARYKALGGVDGKLYAFASPDGLRWRPLRAGPVLTRGAFDSLNVAFWDATARLYRCYSRYWAAGEYAGFRAIQSCTSTDFIHWSEPLPNSYDGGPPDEHYYTSATRPCPGAEHILLAFPMRFVPERTRLPGYREPGVSDAMLLTSRDGSAWTRPSRSAWLKPGRDPRNWTQRSNMPACGIIETGADEWSLYASEHYGWPDNRLRRLRARKLGLCSLRAGAAGGEAVTRVLRFGGPVPLLNLATSAAGSIAVEVQDPGGQALPGYALADCVPLFGDDLDRPVRWREHADVAALIGRPVRLRFALRDADLFAMQFAAAARP